MIRWGHTYDLGDTDAYGPNSNEKLAGLIESVCRAYRTGNLSAEVQFNGLINFQDASYFPESDCVWKDVPKIHSYRDDVTCQICDIPPVL